METNGLCVNTIILKQLKYLVPVKYKPFCSISIVFPVSEKLTAWIWNGR